MNIILALIMIWNSLFQAAAVQAQEAALKQAAMLKAEAALYADQATEVMQAETILLPAITYPGDVILIRSKQSAQINWQNVNYTLLPYDSGFFAYLPISMNTKPGTYTVDGQTLQVKAKSFPTDRLTVTKDQAAMTQDYKRINADQVKINAARKTSDPTFSSTEPFIIPVDDARVSTPYGYTRYVNGVFNGSHTALDLAVPMGTPVKATNAGRVVLADMLYLTGNTVYIDHGMNLFSQYCHMSKLLVKTGDMVKRGEVIGLVGTTGFSTGPHVHFTFWVGNKPVNPNLFIGTTPFQWSTK